VKELTLMTLEANKAVVRRFIEEVFVEASPAAADELASADFTPHSWPGIQPGVENLKQGQKRITAGISDARMTIEDMIAEGDKVAVRLVSHGRHTGEFMGLPPSGREYDITETHIFRLADGKVSDHWLNADMLGLMQQLGALPNEARKAS
jgi:predicted ester cyclase